MTTEKTKAAWEALETIKHYSKCSERGQEAIQNEFDLAVETIAAYITTQAEAQPAEDVREAVGEVEKSLYFTHGCPPSDYFVLVRRRHAETLIRAATAPKQTCERIPCCGNCDAGKDVKIEYVTEAPKTTDAEREKALERANELLDRIDVQCRAVGHPVGGIDELKHIIKAALRTPAAVPHGYDDSYTTNATSGTVAVPVIDIASFLNLAHSADSINSKNRWIEKAIALLGGKEE